MAPSEARREKVTLLVAFDRLLADTLAACRTYYGARLVSLAVFGSVGRGTPRPDSDIDLLLVVDPLPDGRIPRMTEFQAVEHTLAPALAAARDHGVSTRLSPVIKTPQEVAQVSPLLLDMTEDARVLVDEHDALARTLRALRDRLAARGARRVWRGNAWYWDLKPDYRPGEVFEL
jgi:predicted nucleotidyltransferase